MYKIKVIIVDDDPDWIKEMVKIINREKDIIVVGTALSKDSAINLVKTIDIDVILMDINLSGNKCDGITATLEINKIKEIKTIMLTSLTDENIIINSFTAGAKSYISKLEHLKIPDSIRSLFNNTSPIEVLLKDYNRMKEEEQIKELTSTEKEIYKLIEEGSTRSHMQKKLLKSENTIKNQLKNIFKKLKVRNSKQAVEKVKERGTKELEL
jgi:NarL family two-component system response regulator LiaR